MCIGTVLVGFYWFWVLLLLFIFLFCQCDTRAKGIWENGTLLEKLPPSDGPMCKFMGAFS